MQGARCTEMKEESQEKEEENLTLLEEERLTFQHNYNHPVKGQKEV